MTTGAPPPGAGYGAGASGPGYAGAGYYTGTAAPPKRLRRVMEGKKIGGVCTGLAEYFDMDVTLVRLIAVALMLLPPSPGFIVYIVAWMILPRS